VRYFKCFWTWWNPNAYHYEHVKYLLTSQNFLRYSKRLETIGYSFESLEIKLESISSNVEIFLILMQLTVKKTEDFLWRKQILIENTLTEF